MFKKNIQLIESIWLLFILISGIIVTNIMIYKTRSEVSLNLPSEANVEKRVSEYPVNELLLQRWSSDRFSNEVVSKKELFTLFDAARWAASSYNDQPWQFVYVMKESADWEKFFNLMVDFNKGWASSASILIIVLSRKNFVFNNKFSPTHSFDTGAAVQNLSLQGHYMGLVVHSIGGFDYDKAYQVCGASKDEYSVECMIAVGKKENNSRSEEKQVKTGRKELNTFVFEGCMTKK